LTVAAQRHRRPLEELIRAGPPAAWSPASAAWDGAACAALAYDDTAMAGTFAAA
jgi:hypothetical protein